MSDAGRVSRWSASGFLQYRTNFARKRHHTIADYAGSSRHETVETRRSKGILELRERRCQIRG
jgi:hypothetical protein